MNNVYYDSALSNDVQCYTVLVRITFFFFFFFLFVFSRLSEFISMSYLCFLSFEIQCYFSMYAVTNSGSDITFPYLAVNII